jgi:conjugative transposon TraN protein
MGNKKINLKPFFMKTIKILLCLVLGTMSTVVMAQVPGQKAYEQVIEVAFSKTTTLVFPFAVTSVDRGSQDILAQKAKGTENVVQIKAAQQDFEDTNLTVITNDGKLYCFSLCYNDLPGTTAYTFAAVTSPGTIMLDGGHIDAQELAKFAEMALYDKSSGASIREAGYGIELEITGLYIHEDVIYYRVKISNTTAIGYDISQLRFFVRDQRRSKRTASQEVEIIPVSVQPAAVQVPAFSKVLAVYALPKFTIPDKKNLIIELTEKSGGRHLQLKLTNRRAAKVVPLPKF